MADTPDLAPSLQAAIEAPRPPLQGWRVSIGPNLIAAFLWIAFYDQIGSEALGRVRLFWPIAGAAVGGLLAYVLLFRFPADWSRSTGWPLRVLACRTFGVQGSAWIPGLCLAAAHVLWIAVATKYATTMILRGLALIGILDPARGTSLHLGSVELPSGLFLVTALLWALAGTMAGRYIVRVIAALMKVYPVLLAVLFGVTAIASLRCISGYEMALSISTPAGSGAWREGMLAALVALQMVFSFSTLAALTGADWGQVARSKRDVELGGLVGMAGASWIIASLALMTVAGAAAKSGVALPASDDSLPTFAQSVEILIGGWPAGTMLLIFGLAGLAPACFCSFALGYLGQDILPRVSRTKWTILASLVAWLLVAFGCVDRLFLVFGAAGALLAPVCGVMAADYLGGGGAWTSARRGSNRAGWIAWLGGAFVGLLPVIGSAQRVEGLARLQPASVLAFAVAFVLYLVLSRILGVTDDSPEIPASHPGLDVTE